MNGQLRAWGLRLSGMFDRERRDQELAEELQSHLALHIEDNLQAGMTPEEARRDALLRLGGIESIKELSHSPHREHPHRRLGAGIHAGAVPRDRIPLRVRARGSRGLAGPE